MDECGTRRVSGVPMVRRLQYHLRVEKTCTAKGSSMLILTRRVGETLNIGDGITVTVLNVKGNQVRIGVDAPKEVTVHREEIYEKLLQEKSNPSS